MCRDLALPLAVCCELAHPALGRKPPEAVGHEVAVELVCPALEPKLPEAAGHEDAHLVLE